MTKAIATKVVPNYQFFQLLMKKARKVMKFDSCREEKALRHVAMVPKFFDDNKPIKPLKSVLPDDYNFKGQNNKKNF